MATQTDDSIGTGTGTWTVDRVSASLATADLGTQLERLGFRPEDRDAAVPLLVALTPADRERVAVAANRLVTRIGQIERTDPHAASDPDADEVPVRLPFADCPDEPGRAQGLLPLATLVITADQVRAWHAARGIGPEDSDRALSDFGQQVWVHRLTFGEFGLHTQWWLTVGWSGILFWLGRLQFNLQREGADWVISTHIPQSGPLTPAAVDDAFARARRFFARHFGDLPAVGFFCHSWLLDPQLVEVLAPGANMVAFQQRWHDVETQGSGDGDALFFVFHRRYDWDTPGGPDLRLDTLPQATSLERAIVERLRGGGHWQVCRGTIGFGPTNSSAQQHDPAQEA